jgi:hypothetical protein
MAVFCENGKEILGFIKSKEIFGCLKMLIMRFFHVRLMELMVNSGLILLTLVPRSRIVELYIELHDYRLENIKSYLVLFGIIR